MFEITVKSHFSAAHRLIDYEGKCENLHGHNWMVELCVESRNLDSQSMVSDFAVVKNQLKEILKLFDHQYLNELKFFKKISPTSELIAELIYKEVNRRLKLPDGVRVKSVTVWESENSKATYMAEKK